MTGQSAQHEADLARERNQNIRDRLKKKRMVSVVLAVVCLVAGVAAGIVGLGMVAFCIIVVALICLFTYFDANSHLHEVRQRSEKTLVPDFSLLQRNNAAATANQSQPTADG